MGYFRMFFRRSEGNLPFQGTYLFNYIIITLSEQDFVEDTSEAPDVAFACVIFFSEDLRAHVQGGPNNRVEHLFLEVINHLRETEVSQFVYLLMDQNICRFQITVNYPLFDQFNETCQDALKHFECFLFWQEFFYLQKPIN
jgi:hypothetical protein